MGGYAATETKYALAQLDGHHLLYVGMVVRRRQSAALQQVVSTLKGKIEVMTYRNIDVVRRRKVLSNRFELRLYIVFILVKALVYLRERLHNILH